MSEQFAGATIDMARTALTPWEISNVAQDDSVQNLKIKWECPECKEDPAITCEETSSGDIVCASCGLVLADRLIDTRPEWDLSISNDPTDTVLSYTDYLTRNCSEGQNEECQGIYSQSSVENGSQTSIYNPPSSPTIIMQRVPNVSATLPRAVGTFDATRASYLPQLRPKPERIWSLRYPERALRHRIDYLQKLIPERLTELGEMAREVEDRISTEASLHNERQGRAAAKNPFVGSNSGPRKHVRHLECELNYFKGMLVAYREDNRKGNIRLLSID